VVASQEYEEYWKITLEYTDINDKRWIGTLKIIKDFIDENAGKNYSRKLYVALQKKVNDKFPKADMASVRKSINQFVKLGFVNPHLQSYHPDTVRYLEAKTNRRRQTIFSRVVYENSSFNSSVTNDSKKGHIEFLIKTLEEVEKLCPDDIIALMRVNIDDYHEGYLTRVELERVKIETKEIKFDERKYNQKSHFRSILSRLDDLKFQDNCLYFEEDARRLFPEVLEGRDNYLQSTYRSLLKEESVEKLGEARCMVQDLPFPSLVASHIKPWRKCSKEEAYDPDNGLLLSQDLDEMFDKGYITFDEPGKIILSEKLKPRIKDKLKDFQVNKLFLNKKRIEYLAYHREHVFKK